MIYFAQCNHFLSNGVGVTPLPQVRRDRQPHPDRPTPDPTPRPAPRATRPEDLVPRLGTLLASGQRRVVLDNTYATRTSRYAVIRVAHAHGVPVRCRFLATPIDEAYGNVVLRILERYGPDEASPSAHHEELRDLPAQPRRRRVPARPVRRPAALDRRGLSAVLRLQPERRRLRHAHAGGRRRRLRPHRRSCSACPSPRSPTARTPPSRSAASAANRCPASASRSCSATGSRASIRSWSATWTATRALPARSASVTSTPPSSSRRPDAVHRPAERLAGRYSPMQVVSTAMISAPQEVPSASSAQVFPARHLYSASNAAPQGGA